jgi:transposase
MRIIGLDLAITSAHKAVVADDTGKFLTSVFSVATWADELNTLLQRARAGVAADAPLAVVMEPTGLAWLPVSVYAQRQQVTVVCQSLCKSADRVTCPSQRAF